MVFGTSRLMVVSGSAIYNWSTRLVSVGDGFRLVDESDISQFWVLGRTISRGLQSLGAIKQACSSLGILRAQVELLFLG